METGRGRAALDEELNEVQDIRYGRWDGDLRIGSDGARRGFQEVVVSAFLGQERGRVRILGLV
jgi:hypothetical protein